MDVKTLKMFVEEKKAPLMEINFQGYTIAHVAAEKGNLEIVRYVVDQDPSVLTITTIDQKTIAHLAACSAQWKVFWYVVEKDPSLLTKKDANGNSALHLAVRHNGVNLTVFKSCIKEKGVPLNETNDEGENFAHLAAEGGNLDIIKYIANKVPSLLLMRINDRPLFEFSFLKKPGDTVSAVAAINNHWDIVRYLAERNPLVYTEKTFTSSTVFCQAVKNNNVNVTTLKNLIEVKKVPLNLVCPDESVAKWALENENQDMFCYLIEKEPSFLAQTIQIDKYHTKGTVAHSALQKEGYLKNTTISYMIEKMPTLFASKDEEGDSLLYLAIKHDLINAIALNKLVDGEYVTLTEMNRKGETIAHAAAAVGTENGVELISYIAEKHASLLARRNNDGDTVAHIAAKSCDIDLFWAIAEKLNPSILARGNCEKNTVLHLLAAAKELELNDLRRLVEKGVPLMGSNSQGETVAHIAARSGLVNIVEYIIQKEPTAIRTRNKVGRTMALTAAEKAECGVLGCIPDVDALFEKDNSGNTIFHLIIESGHGLGSTYRDRDNSDACLSILYKVPVDFLTKPNNNGLSVSDLASQIGCETIIERIAREKPSILVKKDHNGDNALLHAARHRQSSIIGLILAKNLKNLSPHNIRSLFEIPNETDIMNIIKSIEKTGNGTSTWDHKYFNRIATHDAIESGHWTILKYFIESKHVDVNVPNDGGDPLIFTTLRCRHYDMLKYLVEQRHANLLLTNDHGDNILFLATGQDGNLTTIKYIMDERKAPIDINWQNKVGDTVLHVAVQYAASQGEDNSAMKMIEYLVEKQRADVNVPDQQNKTVLLRAASHQLYKICDYLLEHGAEPNLKDASGKDFWEISHFNVSRPRRSIPSLVGNASSVSIFSNYLTDWLENKHLPRVVHSSDARDETFPATDYRSQFHNLSVFSMLTLLLIPNRKRWMPKFRNIPSYLSPTEVVRGTIDPIALEAVYTNNRW